MGDLFEYWAELIGLLPEIGEGEDRGLAAEAVKLLPDAIAHYTSYAPDRGTKVFDMFIAQLLGQKLNANIADLAGSLAFAINGLRRNEKENAQRMAVLQSLLSQIAR